MSDKKIQLLIVDDDEDIVLMMKDFFDVAENSKHFLLTTSKSFEEAMSIINIQKFDALITDITIPGGDGLLLADSIYQTNKNAFIVIMSGWSTPPGKTHSAEIKIDAYLKKPFEFDKFDEIITTIASVFNKQTAISK